MISFEYIKSLFNPEEWDVGYLSKDGLLQCANTPIKEHFRINGERWINGIYYNNPSNCIVLMHSSEALKYEHYEKASKILSQSEISSEWYHAYTNFKTAAVLSGLGVRARNSLIYSYKFGFSCHIAVVRFNEEIVDLPKNSRINSNLWNRCKDCFDCVNKCPANAIKGEKEPYWVDGQKCHEFITFGNHPTIPSVFDYWRKNVYNDVSDEEIVKILEYSLSSGFLPWDRNGYEFNGPTITKNGTPVYLPMCRECSSQPRCSKWGGKYPYEDKPEYQVINFVNFK